MESETEGAFLNLLATMANFSAINESFVRTRQSNFERIIKSRPSKRPNKVYHYTGYGGFEGILQSNFLRATDYRVLNDTSELVYGASILVSELEVITSNSPSPVSTFLRELICHYRDADWYRNFFETYVVSFSEDPDLLGQWRAYADQGRGCCLEFDLNDSQMFSVVGTGAPWAYDVCPVIYEEREQRGLVREGVEAILSLLEDSEWSVKKILASSATEQAIIFGFVMNSLEPFIGSFKHPGFSDEREWRAITSCARNLTSGRKQFVENGVSSRAYLECIFIQGDEVNLWQRSKLPITAVFLGPLSSEGETRKLVELLHTHGYLDGIKIGKSKLPLRL